jgi:hypothetical protein
VIDPLLLNLIDILSKFADDTKFGKVIVDQNCRDELQKALDTLCEWADAWQMQFNEAKCKVLHLGRANPMFTYTMNGTTLGTTTCEKDVGVFISDDLKPSTHSMKAASKASAVLGMMGRSFHYRSKSTWINLYKMYVRPHLEYASPAWNPWLRKDVQALEKVQERAVRMCSGLKGVNYESRLKELGLDNLETRRLKTDLIQVWKIVHGFDNINESDLFERLHVGATINTRATSSQYNLKRNVSNIDIRRNFFSCRIVESWNSLPEDVKSAQTISVFKNKLKRHFSAE